LRLKKKIKKTKKLALWTIKLHKYINVEVKWIQEAKEVEEDKIFS